jgi:hypothetical protein
MEDPTSAEQTRVVDGILEFGRLKGGNAREVAIQSWQSRLRLMVAQRLLIEYGI